MKQLLVLGFVIVFMPLYLFAQEIPVGEIENTQIIIEKDKPLTLPRANKIFEPDKESIKMEPGEAKVTTYDLSSPAFEFEKVRFLPAIKPYQVSDALLENTNFVKVGYGNYASPLINAAWNVKNETDHLGLWIKHESFARGPVRDEESAYGLTDIFLHSGISGNNFSFEPSIHYRRERFHFYGYDETADSLDVYISDPVRSNYLAINTLLIGSYDEKWRLSLKPGINWIGVNIKNEGTFNTDLAASLDGDLDYQINKQFEANISLSAGVWNYESEISQQRSILGLKPAVTWSGESHQLKMGIGLFSGKDEFETFFGVYPILSGHYQLHEGLTLKAALKGGLNSNSLGDLMGRNRFLEDSLVMRIENEKLYVRAGIQLKPVPKLMIEPYIAYRLSRNSAFFVPSFTDTSRFVVIYESGDFGQLDIGVTTSYMFNQSSLSGELIYTSYATDIQNEAWYLPSTRLKLNWSQQVLKSLSVNTYLIVLQGIKGIQATQGTTVELPTILELGVGANYRISDNLSAFIDLRNLTNQEYERYLNYPVRGMTGKIGFIYQF